MLAYKIEVAFINQKIELIMWFVMEETMLLEGGTPLPWVVLYAEGQGPLCNRRMVAIREKPYGTWSEGKSLGLIRYGPKVN